MAPIMMVLLISTLLTMDPCWHLRQDKTKCRPQLHPFSLWQTKNITTNKIGQFTFVHININIFLPLSTILQPDCQRGLGFEIDFLSSDAKGVIEKFATLCMHYQKKYNNYLLFGCCCCSRKSCCEKCYSCFLETSYSGEAICLAQMDKTKNSQGQHFVLSSLISWQWMSMTMDLLTMAMLMMTPHTMAQMTSGSWMNWLMVKLMDEWRVMGSGEKICGWEQKW